MIDGFFMDNLQIFIARLDNCIWSKTTNSLIDIVILTLLPFIWDICIFRNGTNSLKATLRRDTEGERGYREILVYAQKQ